MDSLPDAVLVAIARGLDLRDAVALSQTCTRLQHLVLHVTVAGSDPAAASTTLQSMLAAAEQRLHAVTGGTWRDALLLAAWQRQQQQQQQTLTNRLKGLQLEARDPLGVDSPLLDQVLTGPDAAAGLITGTLTPAGTSTSSSSGGVSSSNDASSSSGASSGQGRDSRTEFSLYWQPGNAQLRQASCLVTDGRAAALLQPLPSDESSTAPHPRSSTNSTTPLDPAAAAAAAVSGRSVSTGAGTPPIQGSNRLGLLHAHLPPAELTTSQSLHQLLLNPVGQQQPSASSSSSSSSWASLDLQRLQSLLGLRHLYAFLRCWWAEADSSAPQNSSSAADDGGNSSGQKQTAAAAAAAVDSHQGPRQALLLPAPPPAGSISGLQCPWPPALAPGSAYQGLGQPGCDVGSGLRACRRLLQDALLLDQSALLVPAGAGGANRLPHMGSFGVPPPSWCGQLACLDLSGQLSVSDDVLGTTLVNSSSSLRALSIADTSAGPLTFMLWPPRTAAAGASAQPAAVPSAAAATRSDSLHARLLQGFGRLPQQQQQQQQPAGAGGQTTSPANIAGAGPPPSSVPSQLPPPCCLLQVLDVSGCASLAATRPASAVAAPCGWGSVFRLFQASLAALPHLEVLLAARLNVAHALTCAACQEERREAAAAATASGTAATAAAPDQAAEQRNTVTANTSSSSSSSSVRCGFCSTLAGLIELDVSAATALSVPTLTRLLRGCSSLRRLAVAGCKTLAEGEGVQQLEAAVNSLAQQQQQQRQQQRQQQHDPSTVPPTSSPGAAPSSRAAAPVLVVGQGLHRLCVGWGWSAASISTLLRGAPFLVSFNAGVGACVTDGVLQQLGSSCPHLQSLSLSLCTVTSTGVSAVIGGCPHLTALQLQQCVGPFDVGHMLRSTGASQQQQQQQQAGAVAKPHTGAAAAAPKRWQLSALQLSGPTTACTDAQLLALLGLRWREQQQAPRNTRAAAAAVTATTTSSSGSRAVTLPTGPLHSRQPSARVVTPYLTALCLVRVNGLTDALLHHVAAADCHLQHLRLEYCYTQTAAAAAAAVGRELSGGVGVMLPDESSGSSSSGSSSSSSGGSSGVDSRGVSFSAAALLQLVGASCSLSLHSLSLRHAVILPPGFVSGLVQRAPLLQMLVLDGCDLTGTGFELEPNQHGALSAVHVVRCQHIDGRQQHHHHYHSDHESHPGAADATDSDPQSPATAAAAAVPGAGGEGSPSGRLRDRDLVVHLLQLRRSIHLPPG